MELLAKISKWAKRKRKGPVVPRITARVIIEHNNQYLYLRQTAAKGGNLSLPGGGIKRKESVKKGLVRELKEETNLSVFKRDLVPVHTHYRRKGRNLEVVLFFKTTIDNISDLKLLEP